MEAPTGSGCLEMRRTLHGPRTMNTADVPGLAGPLAANAETDRPSSRGILLRSATVWGKFRHGRAGVCGPVAAGGVMCAAPADRNDVGAAGRAHGPHRCRSGRLDLGRGFLSRPAPPRDLHGLVGGPGAGSRARAARNAARPRRASGSTLPRPTPFSPVGIEPTLDFTGRTHPGLRRGGARGGSSRGLANGPGEPCGDRRPPSAGGATFIETPVF
jgi:hypothetical protein